MAPKANSEHVPRREKNGLTVTGSRAVEQLYAAFRSVGRQGRTREYQGLIVD